MMIMVLIQATWLSKLHEAQEKYQETVRTRYREAGELLPDTTGASCHGDTVNITVDASLKPVVPAHGDCRSGPTDGGAASGRSWLGTAGTTSSLNVPSFAVSDYEELVRTSFLCLVIIVRAITILPNIRLSDRFQC